jgi:hypothetical protein
MLLHRVRGAPKQEIQGSLPVDRDKLRRQAAEDHLSTEVAWRCSNHHGMAIMTTKKSIKRLTEDEVDRIVIDQANRDSAWEKPVHVKRPKGSALTIPSDLAARASFLARLHGSSGLDEWVTHVLRERVELEEGALSVGRPRGGAEFLHYHLKWQP